MQRLRIDVPAATNDRWTRIPVCGSVSFQRKAECASKRRQQSSALLVLLGTSFQICRVFQKEFHKGIPNVTVWRVFKMLIDG
jgi:hypothetical protein